CGFIRSCVLLTVSISFFFNYSATTASSTLSLHDALPIWSHRYWSVYRARFEPEPAGFQRCRDPFGAAQRDDQHGEHQPHGFFHRSEEHTSELQSRFDLVCRLLLEKKKKSS